MHEPHRREVGAAERSVKLHPRRDDRHLDFRVSVLVEDGVLTVATRVRLRNRVGRAYFAPLRLVHPLVVRVMVARAVAAPF